MKRDPLQWLTARPIAHRGLHNRERGRPENTLAAFDAAVSSHYAIECDIHLSADGVPIVFHDDDLERLTGVPGQVRDMTAAELGDLRVLGTPEWIPTLDEMLALVAGRVPIIAELKSIPGRNEGLVREAVRRLHDYAGSSAVMSFDPRLLAEAKPIDPTAPIGLVAMGNWRTGLTHFRHAWRLGVDFISYSIDDLPTPMPLIARRFMKIPLICWTVRTRQQFEKAQKLTDQITFEGIAE